MVIVKGKPDGGTILCKWPKDGLHIWGPRCLFIHCGPRLDSSNGCWCQAQIFAHTIFFFKWIFRHLEPDSFAQPVQTHLTSAGHWRKEPVVRTLLAALCSSLTQRATKQLPKPAHRFWDPCSTGTPSHSPLLDGGLPGYFRSPVTRSTHLPTTLTGWGWGWGWGWYCPSWPCLFPP